MTDTKIIHQETVECPYCKKKIEVRLQKETITKPEKGEYSTYMTVDKATQTTLEGI